MASLSTTDGAAPCDIIANYEEWLIDRILSYARRQGYTRHSHALREALRSSIHGLSASVRSAMQNGITDVEFTPEEDVTVDPLAQFGIIESMHHKRQGISLPMFLGLLKYYRQSYMDLIKQESPDRGRNKQFYRLLGRLFDRIEIGLCTAWHASPEDDRLVDLQRANRAITNEKNKYLTILESLHSPVAVTDCENEITTSNHAWKVLFGGNTIPGADYCVGDPPTPEDWLVTAIDGFVASKKDETVLEKEVSTDHGKRHLCIRIKRMLDDSGENSGCVVILDDVTLQKKAEEATCNSERLHGALELAGAVCHDLNQPLMAISGYAEILLMDCPEDAPHFSKLKKIVNQVKRLGDITKRLMHVTRYETKIYMDKQIIDIEKASGDK